jgi:hypothetical protein
VAARCMTWNAFAANAKPRKTASAESIDQA